MNPVTAAAFSVIVTITFATAQTTEDLKTEVLKAEAAFDTAKLHNDVAALDRLLADECIEINQWGAKRDKRELIELFRNFAVTALVPTGVTVRASADFAIIDGIMHESNHEMRFQFMRTYVKRQGHWQLLSSTQLFAVDPETMKVIDPGQQGQSKPAPKPRT